MNPLWSPYLENVLAYWSKRDCPGDQFECRGSVKVSADGRFLFIPNDARLHPVEAEVA